MEHLKNFEETFIKRPSLIEEPLIICGKCQFCKKTGEESTMIALSIARCSEMVNMDTSRVPWLHGDITELYFISDLLFGFRQRSYPTFDGGSLEEDIAKVKKQLENPPKPPRKILSRSLSKFCWNPGVRTIIKHHKFLMILNLRKVSRLEKLYSSALYREYPRSNLERRRNEWFKQAKQTVLESTEKNDQNLRTISPLKTKTSISHVVLESKYVNENGSWIGPVSPSSLFQMDFVLTTGFMLGCTALRNRQIMKAFKENFNTEYKTDWRLKVKLIIIPDSVTDYLCTDGVRNSVYIDKMGKITVILWNGKLNADCACIDERTMSETGFSFRFGEMVLDSPLNREVFSYLGQNLKARFFTALFCLEYLNESMKDSGAPKAVLQIFNKIAQAMGEFCIDRLCELCQENKAVRMDVLSFKVYLIRLRILLKKLDRLILAVNEIGKGF